MRLLAVMGVSQGFIGDTEGLSFHVCGQGACNVPRLRTMGQEGKKGLEKVKTKG